MVTGWVHTVTDGRAILSRATGRVSPAFACPNPPNDGFSTMSINQEVCTCTRPIRKRARRQADECFCSEHTRVHEDFYNLLLILIVIPSEVVLLSVLCADADDLVLFSQAIWRSPQACGSWVWGANTSSFGQVPSLVPTIKTRVVQVSWFSRVTISLSNLLFFIVPNEISLRAFLNS